MEHGTKLVDHVDQKAKLRHPLPNLLHHQSQNQSLSIVETSAVIDQQDDEVDHIFVQMCICGSLSSIIPVDNVE